MLEQEEHIALAGPGQYEDWPAVTDLFPVVYVGKLPPREDFRDNSFLLFQESLAPSHGRPSCLSAAAAAAISERAQNWPPRLFLPLHCSVEGTLNLFDPDEVPHAVNLSPGAKRYLAALGMPETALFYHALAVLNTAEYPPRRPSGSSGQGQQMARIPLPAHAETLEESAAIGRRIAALYGSGARVPELDGAQPDTRWRPVARLQKQGNGIINPHGNDLCLEWGAQRSPDAITWRLWDAAELAQLNQLDGRRGAGLPPTQTLGGRTADIRLNKLVCWRGVPEAAWNLTRSNRPILADWLQDHSFDTLHRNITGEEAKEFTHLVRRLSLLVTLGPQLKQNLESCMDAVALWAPPRPRRRAGASASDISTSPALQKASHRYTSEGPGAPEPVGVGGRSRRPAVKTKTRSRSWKRASADTLYSLFDLIKAN